MTAPALRFKEFDGGWEKSKLGNEAQFFQGEQVSLDDQYKEYSDGLTKFLRIENFTQNSKDFRYIKYIGSKEKRLNEQDIAIVRYGATAGFICSGEIGVIANNLFKVSVDNKRINQRYLELVLKSEKTFNYFQAEMSGGAMPALNFKIVGNLNITYSSIEEQTKIASFLSAVDEKISQLNQKHRLLCQYKQGMMQKLFSQQLRFKSDDGSEFGEWEKFKFSEQFKFHNTNSHSRALLAVQGEIMNIHYGDIHTKFSMLFDVKKEVVPFLNDQVDTSKINGEQFLKVGDLVIADASEDYKDIGKSIEIIDLDNQKVVAGLHTYIARPIIPFALGFCGYMMQTFVVRDQIKTFATGISVLGISKTNLGKVELKIPSFDEQTKIANFLSAIDQKIEVVAQQIEQAKQWKKGLLQQMFV